MRKNGFTLIELLVVIFIIGALAGLVLPNFVSSRERARDSKRKQDLFEIKSALRLYYNDNQSYPAVGDLIFGSPLESDSETYMAEVPEDQIEGRERGYCVSSDGEEFLLWAGLENEGDQEMGEAVSRCGVSEWLIDSDCGLGDGDCYIEGENYCYYVCGG